MYTKMSRIPSLQVRRMCCRRVFLGYVDVLADQLQYGNLDVALGKGVVLRRRAVADRTVSCD